MSQETKGNTLVLAAAKYATHDYRVISDVKPSEVRKSIDHTQYDAFLDGARWALDEAAKLADTNGEDLATRETIKRAIRALKE